MMQGEAKTGARALAIVAGLLTAIQLLGVAAAFLALAYFVVLRAPGYFDALQSFWASIWSASTFWAFWAVLALLFFVALGVGVLAVLATLGYLVGLFGVAAVSLLRGRAERLAFAGVVNAFAAALWAVFFGLQFFDERAEGMALFGALFAVALVAAVCCFVARSPRQRAA